MLVIESAAAAGAALYSAVVFIIGVISDLFPCVPSLYIHRGVADADNCRLSFSRNAHMRPLIASNWVTNQINHRRRRHHRCAASSIPTALIMAHLQRGLAVFNSPGAAVLLQIVEILPGLPRNGWPPAPAGHSGNLFETGHLSGEGDFSGQSAPTGWWIRYSLA